MLHPAAEGGFYRDGVVVVRADELGDGAVDIVQNALVPLVHDGADGFGEALVGALHVLIQFDLGLEGAALDALGVILLLQLLALGLAAGAAHLVARQGVFCGQDRGAAFF